MTRPSQQPISTRTPEVAVEYDCRGKRQTKHFKDAQEAKRFYTAKDKAGRNPKVVSKKKTPAKKAPVTDRDAFGSAPGTISHSMNTPIIAAKGKPVTVDVIVAKSGASRNRVHCHIRWLLERDCITRTSDGGCRMKRARSTK